jgi:hypothetical protein
MARRKRDRTDPEVGSWGKKVQKKVRKKVPTTFEPKKAPKKGANHF